MYRFPKTVRHCLILLMAYMSFSPPASASQLNCNNHLIASVGSNCDLDLSVDVLIVGTYDLSLLTYSLYNGAVPVDLSSDASAYLGHTLTFKVQDITDGNYCWGEITIEDKAPPALDCGPCSDPSVSDPACIFKCPSYELFSTLDRYSGQTGYATELLNKLTASDSESFIAHHVSDNCGQAVTASYTDVFLDGECGASKTMIRTWLVDYDTPHGPGSLQCTQYFAFEAFDFLDDDGQPIAVEGDGTPIEDHILLPINHITIPSCHLGYKPADIAVYFDDPTTEDMDSDGDGKEPSEDLDCVIENNEGIPYAYPHYYMPGLGVCPAAPGGGGTGGSGSGTGSGTPGGGGGTGSTMNAPLHPQPIDDKVCNVNVFYNDTSFDGCAPECHGNVKVSREWTIMNWCTGVYFTYVQNIAIVDKVGPEVLVRDFVSSVDPWQCASDVQVPAPEHLRDNCDDIISYEVQLVDNANLITGNSTDGYVINGVPPGIYQVLYRSTDCCGNTTKEYVQLQVLDATPPVAVTLENLVLDLTYTELGVGTGKIHAADIDNQSYDACGPVVIEIRRGKSFCNPQDTIWGDHVSFCCEDLQGQEFQLIDVEFRVSDWLGNANLSWTKVRLEGKGGILSCPPDMVLTCITDYHDFDNTGGIPVSYTSCDAFPAVVDTLAVKDDTKAKRKGATIGNVPGYIGVQVEAYNPACGFGAIERKFDQCTQWLVIEPIEDVFDPSTIVFPEDVTVDCVDFETGEPVWMEAQCNLVGFTLDSDTFRIESNSCAEIINTWSVIDWCAYDMTTGAGKYTKTQIVSVVDDTTPEILTEQLRIYAADENCLSNGIVLSAMGLDSAGCDSPWLSWEVEVDIDDDFNVEYVYSSKFPKYLANGDLNPFYLEKTITNELIQIQLPDGIVGSKKEHRIDWKIDDGCRNINQIRTYFQIADQKAPTPYCLDISTAVMTNGEVELWAIDFNRNSFDNCTDQNNLNFTFTDVPPPPRCDREYDSALDLEWYDGTFWFYDSEEVDNSTQECGVTGSGEYKDLDEYGGDIHRWEPGLRSSGKIFTTADDEDKDGILMIPIYVWDECQNLDYCTVTLRIDDNGGGAIIAGEITTESGHRIQNIETQLMANMPGYPKTLMTSTDGEYSYSGNTFTMDYEISGGSRSDYLNGVSTLDLVMIQRHVLGIETFDSPYDYIAADVNGDNKINGIDLVELRKLILGIYTELPQNDSWKLVDASQTLPQGNPWAYRESIYLTDLSADMMSQNFIGVKVGDVNDDVVVNLNSEQPASETLNFSYEDRTVEVGQQFDVTLSSQAALQGFQMSLFIPELEWVGYEGVGFSDQNFHNKDSNVKICQHLCSTSEGGLLTLTFKAKTAGNISNLLHLDSSFKNEVYLSETTQKMNLSLGMKSQSGLKLLQNNPNPFTDHTFIKYELDSDSEVQLILYRTDGTVIKTIETEGVAGLNHVKINGQELGSGVIYCSVESGDNISVIKMMSLR